MARRNQGNVQTSKRSSNLLHETHESCTLALLRYVRLPRAVWEPCAGRGAMARVLRAAGHAVVAQDIRTYLGADDGIEGGVDFLAATHAPFSTCAVVTNPPYDVAPAMIRHALSLGCDFYGLLNLTFLEGERRADIMDGHCVRAWIGADRAPFLHRIGWDGRRQNKSGVPSGWFHFSPQPKRSADIVIRRIYWDVEKEDAANGKERPRSRR